MINNRNHITISFISILLALLLFTCEEEEPILSSIIVETLPVEIYTDTTATLISRIINPGEGIIECGHYWWENVPDAILMKITSDSIKLDSFINHLVGLRPATSYYVKAYATDGIKIVFGQIVEFTTQPALPTVITTEISAIKKTSAQSGGNVTDEGGSMVLSKGVCWSTNQNPTIEDKLTNDGIETGSFKSDITDLLPNTTYYLKAYATNSRGTAYGDQVSFTTLPLEDNEFMDSRGEHIYKWVRIGDQVWMAENLKYLPAVSPPTEGSQTEPFYYVYDYNGKYVNEAKTTSHYNIYGVLYNWPAAMNGETSSNSNPSGVQGVCPSGWHLPSDAEWTTLINYLGGESIAGGKLKETGTTHWESPNTGATNETGFTALPGGLRYGNEIFGYMTEFGVWWSTSEGGTNSAWQTILFYDSLIIGRSFSKGKEYGFSVRCVKD